MNKLMKKIVTFTCALMATAAFASEPEASKSEQELMLDQREAAKTWVASEDTVAVAVDGLCCATCGIGVKKKVQKLKFVARKGVNIDVENSMAVITLKEASAFDREAIVTAIRKAGYEPMRFYQFDGKGTQESTIAKEG